RSLAFVQILAGIRIGAMTRGHDRSERIAAGAFRVTHRAGELGGMFLGGRVRRHQRVLQRTLLDAEGGVAARRSDTQAVHARAGAGGDEAADDHILLQADQRVLLALDRSLGEDAGGLLERRRRDEAAGLQRRLGDAEQ
ncbi:hypothetical protein QU38_01015, partial [Staphylococcus aureus]